MASGLVLQVKDASHDDGAKIVEGKYENDSHQKWRLQEISPGSGDFYIYNSNSGKVLDVP